MVMVKDCQHTVYFLHGLLSSSHYHFAPQVEDWKEKLTVVPIDLPGHGHCPLDAQPRYLTTAIRYTLGIMDRFGPGHVIAASQLGGPVAVRSALQRADLFRSLVLTGFVPDVPQPIFSGWLEGFRTLASENEHLRRWYEGMHGPRWQLTLEGFSSDVQTRYSEDICVTSEMLGSLTPPTLIVNGSLKSNERNTALDAARFGPTVRGHVIEGVGHIPSRERPQEFNAVVRSFWKETTVASEVAIEG
jgi:pimeloyl-ACP methyl ester carboxylesterase